MNKKIILISLIVIVSAISISGCLEYNEDDNYNTKMSIISHDLKELNNIMNKINSGNDSDVDSQIDLAIAILDNDTQILNDLNNTITNNARKEYITLWVNYMEVSKKSYLELKNVTNFIKTYKDTNMTLSDVMDKIENSYKLMDGYDRETSSIMEKINEYDDKYPIVLINGTTPVYLVDKNITNGSDSVGIEIDEPNGSAKTG